MLLSRGQKGKMIFLESYVIQIVDYMKTAHYRCVRLQVNQYRYANKYFKTVYKLKLWVEVKCVLCVRNINGNNKIWIWAITFFFTKFVIRFWTVHSRKPPISNIPDVFSSSEKSDLHKRIIYTSLSAVQQFGITTARFIKQLLILNITRCFFRSSRLQSPTAMFCRRKTRPSIDYLSSVEKWGTTGRSF